MEPLPLTIIPGTTSKTKIFYIRKDREAAESFLTKLSKDTLLQTQMRTLFCMARRVTRSFRIEELVSEETCLFVVLQFDGMLSHRSAIQLLEKYIHPEDMTKIDHYEMRSFDQTMHTMHTLVGNFHVQFGTFRRPGPTDQKKKIGPMVRKPTQLERWKHEVMQYFKRGGKVADIDVLEIPKVILPKLRVRKLWAHFKENKRQTTLEEILLLSTRRHTYHKKVTIEIESESEHSDADNEQ